MTDRGIKAMPASWMRVKWANEYSYDGNELKDLDKAISGIIYNLLNLPQTITKTDGTTVTYVYSATGNKLRKLLATGGITTISSLMEV